MTRALATKRKVRRSNVPAEKYGESGPEALKATKRKERRNNILDEEEEESGRSKVSNVTWQKAKIPDKPSSYLGYLRQNPQLRTWSE